jgi:transposase
MFSPSEKASIYFYGQPVDLRNGFEGLAAISSEILKDIPQETYFVFLNRKRNRIKILYWTSTNLSFWFVRSRNGVFAPKRTVTSSIDRTELDMILSYNFPKRLMRF